jgi:hypothetical protein
LIIAVVARLTRTETMDPTPDLEARRLFVSARLTMYAVQTARGRIAADGDAGDLLAVAHSLREEIPAVQRRYRLRFEPPYPGVTAGPERLRSGFRLVLACEAFDWEEGPPLGVIFTALIPSRLPQVSVAPAAAGIPAQWRPVTDFTSPA